MSEGDSVQTRSQTAKANAATGSNAVTSPGINTDPADNSPPPGDGGGGDESVGDVKPGDAFATASMGLGGSGPPEDPATRERAALFAACQRLRLKLKSIASKVDSNVTAYHSGDLEASHANRIMIMSYIKSIRRVSAELKTQHGQQPTAATSSRPLTRVTTQRQLPRSCWDASTRKFRHLVQVNLLLRVTTRSYPSDSQPTTFPSSRETVLTGPSSGTSSGSRFTTALRYQPYTSSFTSSNASQVRRWTSSNHF